MASLLLKKMCAVIFIAALVVVTPVMAKDTTTFVPSKFDQVMDYIIGNHRGRMLKSKSTKKECQNLQLTGNTAKVADAAGDTVLVQMKEQRSDPKKCNLDCMLRTKNSDWVAYGMDFQKVLFTPIVLFIICLVVFPCWVCCRCCSKCCGKSMGYGFLCKCCCFMPQKSGPYTKSQSSFVVILYLIFALATFICAVVGLASGAGFGNSLVEATCQFDSTRMSANIILGRVLTPAEKINSLIPRILGDVKNESARAMTARDGRYTKDAQQELIRRMKEFHAYASEIYNLKCGAATAPAQNAEGNYSCEICIVKHKTTVGETISQLDDLTKEPAENVKNDRESVTKYITQAGDQITEVVEAFTDSMETVVAYLKDGGDWDQLGTTAISSATQASIYAPVAASVPFAVMIAGILLTILGLVFLRVAPGKRENKCNLFKCLGGYCVGFSWCSTCLAITITFLVCQILWPFLFVVTDVCIVLDNIPNNISTYVPLPGLPGEMLQSCFDNVTVLPPGATASDNSTGGLDFSSQVNFDSVQPLNETDAMLHEMFTWPFLDNETEMVQAMGGNLVENPPTGATQCERNRTLAIFRLKRMHANITAEKALFKKYMNISIRSMYEIKNITLDMFTIGDIMKEGIKCGEVASEYRAMTGILCGNMLQSITNLISTWLAAGVFGMLLAYLGLKINQRWGGHGFHPYDADGEGFEMTENIDFKGV